MTDATSMTRARGDFPVLGLLTVWRLAIAASALFGLLSVIASRQMEHLLSNNRTMRYPGYDPYAEEIRWGLLQELSQLGSLLVVICYLGLALWPALTRGRSLEPPTAWLQGALALMMVVIAVVSIGFLNGGQLDRTGFLFEHLITPTLVVADFLFVGRARFRTRWWEPLTWVLPTAAYGVAVIMIAPSHYQGMFDPSGPDFAGNFALLLLGTIAVAYVMYAVVRGCGFLHGAVGPPAAASPPSLDPAAPDPTLPPPAPVTDPVPEGVDDPVLAEQPGPGGSHRAHDRG